jgi:hypothetical protein
VVWSQDVRWMHHAEQVIVVLVMNDELEAYLYSYNPVRQSDDKVR